MKKGTENFLAYSNSINAITGGILRLAKKEKKLKCMVAMSNNRK
jgi:hypothetical protein